MIEKIKPFLSLIGVNVGTGIGLKTISLDWGKSCCDL